MRQPHFIRLIRGACRWLARRGVASSVAIVVALAGLAFAGAVATPIAATAGEPYDITVRAADEERGGHHTLAGRTLVAYKLADYVDGTYVSTGHAADGDDHGDASEGDGNHPGNGSGDTAPANADRADTATEQPDTGRTDDESPPDTAADGNKPVEKIIDGVAVRTPDPLRPALNRVLARTAGVDDVTDLPGWDYGDDPSEPTASADPIAWLGGFRQDIGSDQSAGSFGYGWNESGPHGIGGNSPDKAYAGSVREFAAHLVKDAEAMRAVAGANPDARPVTCSAAATCVVPATSSGVYLLVDTAEPTVMPFVDGQGGMGSRTTGSSQPMIVPTRPDDADVASAHPDSDRTRLGTVGALGEIVIKNVADEEVLPGNNPPKQRDESESIGKDAADNGVDIGDVIPYMVSYRVPDLSDYKAALDNADPWIYEYRVIDETQHGLRIDAAPTVDLYAPGARLYGEDGKPLAKGLVTDGTGGQLAPIAAIELERVDAIPGFAKDGGGTPTGQDGQPDAWYYLATDGRDRSVMVVGLGKWLVRHYGDVRLNDRTPPTGSDDVGTRLLHGAQLAIRYTAQITPHILDGTDLQDGEASNLTRNDNRLDYSDDPSDVNSGSHHPTPRTRIRQWTYDIDLTKRSLTSPERTLEGARFTLTVKDNDNPDDRKGNGTTLALVPVDGAAGEYRHPMPGEQGEGELVTGPNGLLRIRGLDLGVYTLTETQAPADHQRLASPEDVTIAATFEDDPTTLTIPDHQTEATLTVTGVNRAPDGRPMLAFSADRASLPEGLSVTETDSESRATWGGQDQAGVWLADDKASWLTASLALYDQPVNVSLPQTGAQVLTWAASAAGLALVGVGLAMIARARRIRGGMGHGDGTAPIDLAQVADPAPPDGAA